MAFPNRKAAGREGRWNKRKEKWKEEKQQKNTQQYKEEMGKIIGRLQEKMWKETSYQL